MGTSVQTHQDGTFPNYTEEKPSPSRKKSMICVDTNGYLIWNHFHLRGILGLDVYVMWPEMFSYVFLIFIGLKWFTTSWNHKYSPQMLWEHHFRPVKMDHSQLYRGETITIKKEINDICWYQWVFDLEAFPPSRYFGVGCVCNVTRYVFPICFLIFMGLKWFTTSWNHKYSFIATIHQIC